MIFISEIGLNYNGNIGLAYELIRQSKYSGADIVKFQLGWRAAKEDINHIDFDMLSNLKKWADFFEIELMFSIFNEEAYDLISMFSFSKYKIASRTLVDNFDLVKKIVDKGMDTYISLGMWTDSELPFVGYDNVHYLWCKSLYPTTPWDMLDLPKDFIHSQYSGYSDHSIGIDLPLLAIARGATIIEKHFTLDKSDTTIRDHALSATPEEYLCMTQIGKEIYKKMRLGI
ncbi:sialic acid synthase SpsE [Methanocalculus sp. AMF5]|uniref:N-acetylneuraminate synthase family protein n=1 Tax=Methanocalculus sp. AMF5 TaxID=1198257 RepID=UPI0020A21CF7|nr:N-acetylneuraminate synthase family protein [Methanocalculus sp. AMF5]MCP1663262.1 sialic acid synthase SpsE [Methanocalculus sp. AMF5]